MSLAPAETADPIEKLIVALTKLPGIGEKSAMRLAYHFLKIDRAEVERLTSALLEVKSKIHFCKNCFDFTEHDQCRLCQNVNRSKQLLCVVEKPSDVLAIETSGRFQGQYHVLHGVLSPLDGVGPEQLRIKELVQRVHDQEVEEVILALNPTVEGETTALYLARLLKPFQIRTTRLAHGIPVGGVLEFVDKQTIGRALENRIGLS